MQAEWETTLFTLLGPCDVVLVLKLDHIHVRFARDITEVLDDHYVCAFADHFQAGVCGLFSHNNAGGFVIRKIECYGRKVVDPRSV